MTTPSPDQNPAPSVRTWPYPEVQRTFGTALIKAGKQTDDEELIALGQAHLVTSTDEKLKNLLNYSQMNARVCPMPQQWNTLYNLLPNRQQKPSGGWEPSLPLILAAWHDTPALLKILRLREHIEYAAAHGVLGEVDTFLRNLTEDGWYHLRD